MGRQNTIERLLDRLDGGALTADQANVELVRAERVRIVWGRLPRQLRNAFNAAVKAGRLGHLKKAGLKPEAYFHPSFAYLAIAERNQIERAATAAIRRLAGAPGAEEEAAHG
jgi:hypothetical protein